jgi:hypothetical protein
MRVSCRKRFKQQGSGLSMVISGGGSYNYLVSVVNHS